MKRILFFISGLVLMASCQHDVVYEVDYNITLDKANTYYAGEPVRFNLAGEVDNVIFYSGETGHQYVYRNRYEVPLEDVKSANLHLEINGRYGVKGSLELYVTNGFAGLAGNDGEGDRRTIQTMVDNGMDGWDKLTVDERENEYVVHDIPLNDYLDNMCVALHWCPETHTKVQRTYWIRGYLSLEMEGVEPMELNILDLGFISVMMNEEIEDPYQVNLKNASGGNVNGCVRYDVSAAPIVFQGVSKYDEKDNTGLPYALDGWLISTPQTLNKVSNDTPQFVKNLQNYCQPFEHVYEKPGIYKVTFVGRNENYASASEQIKEFTINNLEKPDLQ